MFANYVINYFANQEKFVRSLYFIKEISSLILIILDLIYILINKNRLTFSDLLRKMYSAVLMKGFYFGFHLKMFMID